MLSQQNIRGLIYLAILAIVCILIGYFAKPREGLTLVEKREATPTTEKRDTLFTFDPNTVTYDELLLLGFDKRTAVGIIKYRTAGKVFGIVEELALCYGVTDSMFARVRPRPPIYKDR